MRLCLGWVSAVFPGGVERAAPPLERLPKQHDGLRRERERERNARAILLSAACISSYKCIGVHILYTYMAYLYLCKDTYRDMYIYIYIHTVIFMSIYIYIYIYIYVY